MVKIPDGPWTRCGRDRVQIHHQVKRARGGELLDGWIIEHLAALCQTHHMFAEESGEETGLLIDGYVGLDQNGLPVYEGSSQMIKDALEQALERWTRSDE